MDDPSQQGEQQEGKEGAEDGEVDVQNLILWILDFLDSEYIVVRHCAVEGCTKLLFTGALREIKVKYCG